MRAARVQGSEQGPRKHARIMPKYWDDYALGDRADCGEVRVDGAEVRTFAERYDPQPIHIDPVAAAASPYGGIIASGWHTAAMIMRVLIDSYFDGTTSLGSPGIGKLSWLKPVRPDDVLRVHVRIREKRRSQSKPDRGSITMEVSATNQHGETVLTASDWIGIMLVRPT